jgi:hypothetical protein
LATALDLQFNTAQATVDTARAVHQDRLTAGDVLAQRTFNLQVDHPNLSIHTPTHFDSQILSLDSAPDLTADGDTAIDPDVAIEGDARSNDEVKLV